MIDLKQLKSAAVAAGGTAWKWWDSCSFRRLTFEKGQHTRDGDALSGCIQPSDGHPDVQMGPGVREFIELASPAAIIEIVERLDSATSNHSCPHEECAEPDRCSQAAACVDSWGYVNAHVTAQGPSVPEGLIAALRNQRRIDKDGSEVAVSRQAVDKAADLLDKLATLSADGQTRQDLQTSDQANIQHAENCKDDDCDRCNALLEFYMACDKCGHIGNKDASGWAKVGDQFFCKGCAQQDADKVDSQPLTGDEIRAAVKAARNASGPSDATQPGEYVLAGAQAAIAKAAPAMAGVPVASVNPQITLTLRQAVELVEFFGGCDAEVSIGECPFDPPGLYAWCTEYPEEGSQYLGPTEVDDDLAVNGIQPASREDARDAARYRYLRDHVCNSLHLSRDGDHACNYVTAKEWIEKFAPADDFADIDPVELERMKATNTIWCLQIYPDTPVGFNVWNGATLDSVINKAMQQEGQP
ncbi:hypothetical protein [Paralcaligenes ginsengisoli]